MNTKTIKTIFKVFGIVFLAYYFLLMILIGWGYVLHYINPKLINWTQVTFGLDEFSFWIMLIAGTAFLFLGLIPSLIFLIFYFFNRKILASILFVVLVVYSVVIVYFIKREVYFIGQSWLIMISILSILPIISIILSKFGKKYFIKEIEKLDQEKKSNQEIVTKGWLILAINILVPYLLFLLYLGLIGMGADVFVQYLVFVIPLYIMSGIFNMMILRLLSRFDKRVLNIKFVFLFVICFSVLTLAIRPLLFIPVIFFFILLFFTIFIMNYKKNISKIFSLFSV